MYIYIHTYIHTYTDTYIHTYIHTLHYITLHYITLHCITLHYITLHYITLHYIHTYIHTCFPRSPSDSMKHRSAPKEKCPWCLSFVPVGTPGGHPSN